MPLNRPASRRLIAAAALVILFGTPAFAQQTQLSVGYVGINSDNVIAFIAKETGIFAKEWARRRTHLLWRRQHRDDGAHFWRDADHANCRARNRQRGS